MDVFSSPLNDEQVKFVSDSSVLFDTQASFLDGLLCSKSRLFLFHRLQLPLMVITLLFLGDPISLFGKYKLINFFMASLSHCSKSLNG